MKHEIGTERPAALRESWPGQYDLFSHFEFVAGVPQPLFLITTRKANGAANACLHSWSSFSGDAGGFFAILGGLMPGGHTFRNILREGVFCVNFLGAEHLDACLRTVEHNGDDTDELAAAGLTAEPAQAVDAPRVAEAFLTLECRLERHLDLSGRGITELVIGRVMHAAVEEGRNTRQALCGPSGFLYNLHSPTDPATGHTEPDGVMALTEVRHG